MYVLRFFSFFFGFSIFPKAPPEFVRTCKESEDFFHTIYTLPPFFLTHFFSHHSAREFKDWFIRGLFKNSFYILLLGGPGAPTHKINFVQINTKLFFLNDVSCLCLRAAWLLSLACG